MTYRTYEDSVASGCPIELYRFYTADGDEWFYCTGGEDVQFLGDTYKSQAIMSSALKLCDDSESITISLWKGAEVATQYIDNPVDSELQITVYRQHVDQYIQYWDGVVVSASFDKDAVPSLVVETGVVASSHMGHRRHNQRSCDHALYSVGHGCCNVVKASFTVIGTLSGVNETTLTSSDFATVADGWFVNGVLTIGLAKRLIVAHTGNTVSIRRSIAAAQAGNVFTATAGCDHLAATCTSKFNNKLNFGGNEYLSTTNAYTGHHVMY